MLCHELEVGFKRYFLFSPKFNIFHINLNEFSQYRKGAGRFVPENVDPFLCTHVIYAFAYIDEIDLLLTTIEDNDLGK